jgi:hypothetical protein
MFLVINGRISFERKGPLNKAVLMVQIRPSVVQSSENFCSFPRPLSNTLRLPPRQGVILSFAARDAMLGELNETLKLFESHLPEFKLASNPVIEE